ncbi:hypothetical protein Pla123a_23180 [Posidoniimonas polymericola]|uniref:Tetratricopeptide repeat-like domain-containing protein n=1 Tax=Posidoniimonas polymericola TaxID=2528002 RepID=A0A5C5YPP5_9BACT|nr:hypothetical protein [Posidoniimonas polymericola]TWT76894.1 hypothetical protein Pla123a_23180 [Posidoniimonas polymericola]
MDSQHRHELAENELAHWLEDFIENVKPYASLILIGVIGAIALFTAWGYYQKSNKASRAADWSLYTMTALEGVPRMSTLETAALELDDAGAPANFASITWAEGKLYEASESVLTDRDNALKATDNARQKFERLLQAKGVSQEIRDRAQFGLARSYELDSDYDKAIEAYKATKGVFAELAAERAEELAKDSLKEDLQWLAAAKAPQFSMPSGPGAPGQQPDFSPDDLDLGAAGQAEPESDITLDDLLESYQGSAAAEDEPMADEEPAAEEAAGDEAGEGDEAPATKSAAAPEAESADAESEPADAESTDDAEGEPTDE